MPHIKIYDVQHFRDLKVSPETRANLEANEVLVFMSAFKRTFSPELKRFHLKTVVHMDTSPMRVCLDITDDDLKALLLTSDFCNFLEVLDEYNSPKTIPESIIQSELLRQGDMEIITERN